MSTDALVEQTVEQEIPTFRLKLKEVPIRLVGATDGMTRNYTIRQMTGVIRDAYLEWQRQRVDRHEDGSVKILNYMDLEAHLIALMLHDDKGVPVPITEIRQYPDEIQEELFRICNNVQGMGKEGLEAAKND